MKGSRRRRWGVIFRSAYTSLARPGGNVTGQSILLTDSVGKRVDLLRDLLPGFRRLGLFGNLANSADGPEWKAAQSEARALGIESISLAAGFGQIEGQVMKVGMVAEATCISKPWTVIPMVITSVQDYIAAGQFRGGEQLIEAQNTGRPGTILVIMEPIYQGDLTA